MAKKFYQDIDLKGNSIQQFKVHNVTTLSTVKPDGITPLDADDKGRLEFKTSDNTLYVWNGIAWQQAGGVSGQLMSWKDSVISRVDTAQQELDGVRYLLSDNTVGTVMNGVAGDIVEYKNDVADWVVTTPALGDAVIVQDEPTKVYVYGGTTWTAQEWEATVGGVATELNGRAIDVKTDGSTITVNGTNQLEVSSTVLTSISTAQSAADAAQSTADTALANAATADGKAVAAQSTADAAIIDAATADGKAVAAQSTADTALANAAAAQGTADTALANAAAAQGTADAAQAAFDNLTDVYREDWTSGSWASVTGGWQITIASTTHGQGTSVNVSTYELDGTDYDEVETGVKIKANGDIVISSSFNFAGYITISGRKK